MQGFPHLLSDVDDYERLVYMHGLSSPDLCGVDHYERLVYIQGLFHGLCDMDHYKRLVYVQSV